ncbi:L-lysine 6-transaminase, partial [bacterium]|nr:L-lysine 6-transaminase [bacterium]
MAANRFVSAVAPDKVHATIGKRMLADGFDIVMDLEKSKGAYIHDSKSGKDYLDFFTCFASSPIGFNHPRLTEASFVEKLGRAAVNKPSNSDLYTTEMAEFVDTFGEIAVPPEMKHLFFISGGALAVENALKTAFDWKVRKNMAAGINRADTPEHELKGMKVLHFQQAFHGRTGYTLALTNTFDPRKTQYFPKFDWPRVLNPKAAFPLEGDNLAATEKRELESLAQIRSAISENPNDIACILIEPIQGEGGDNHFRPEFMQALRKIADESDILLAFDEVQTGLGMTGTMWCYQQLGMVPDIVCFGKKAQVCGIMVTDRIDDIDDNVFSMSSRINSTWGGNLIDMIRCQRYLEVIHEDGLVANASAMGTRFLDGLHAIAGTTEGAMSNVRGRGLMCAY